MNTLESAKQIEDYVIDFRRELHMNPEISEEEFETQKRVLRELDKYGIGYEKVGNTSIIATITGTKESEGQLKTIALRADMDALPMQEETEVPFKSTVKNVGHMCGHDVHTAMLVGCGRLLAENRDTFSGTVKLFFQEGEEKLCGSKHIIEAGGMKDVEMIFALHCMQSIHAGEISITPGYQLSGGDEFEINWTGVSGHGSSPHLAHDSIQAAAVFVADLQGAVTKVVNPLDTAVVTVGKFQGGSVANIIAKYTETGLTFRYFKDHVRKAIHQSVTSHAQCIGEMYGVKADVNIIEKVGALNNDPDVVDFVKQSFAKIVSPEAIKPLPPLMSSEDFSLYLKYAPGAMGWLGIGNEDTECIYYPHHEKFKVDEEGCKYGVALFTQVALDFLNEK